MSNNSLLGNPARYFASPPSLSDGDFTSLTTNSSGALRVDLVVDEVTLSSSSTANTTGGTSTYTAPGGTGNALLTNTVVQVGTAAAHNVYSWNFVNTGASVAYVQVFDSVAASVTLGTTIPKQVLWVPAGGAWEEKFTNEAKMSFTSGIAVAATTTTTGSTAPATGILANISYL